MAAVIAGRWKEFLLAFNYPESIRVTRLERLSLPCVFYIDTSLLFVTHWGQTGEKIKFTTMHCQIAPGAQKNAIYNICTIFRLHAVYQNHQLEPPYKPSANLQIAHFFALPAGSAKIWL